MSASGVKGQRPLLANPFSQWKSAVNQDLGNTVVSNLPDELAAKIFGYMSIRDVKSTLDICNTEMRCNRYILYRNLLGMRPSLTGTELAQFQRLLSVEAPTLIAGEIPVLRPWAKLLADQPISLSELRHLDLSDSTNITAADLIALTKSSSNLTKLILPGAFPSDEVMAVLRTNCPQAMIYPSAMTEHEWAHPAEFMAKLPPPPQEVADFINGPRPVWEGKTSAQAHMVMPKVNKIVRNIDGRSVMVPWTLNNVSELDKATGGVGCHYIWNKILVSAVDKPPTVGFEWLVFTTDVLPQSRNQYYADQKQLTEHWGYEMPGFLDATTCMLWENRLSGNHIYNDNPSTYTRCKEQVENWQLIAGGFAPGGMWVYNFDNVFDYIGVGGLRKFPIK